MCLLSEFIFILIVRKSPVNFFRSYPVTLSYQSVKSFTSSPGGCFFCFFSIRKSPEIQAFSYFFSLRIPVRGIFATSSPLTGTMESDCRSDPSPHKSFY